MTWNIRLFYPDILQTKPRVEVSHTFLSFLTKCQNKYFIHNHSWFHLELKVTSRYNLILKITFGGKVSLCLIPNIYHCYSTVNWFCITEHKFHRKHFFDLTWFSFFSIWLFVLVFISVAIFWNRYNYIQVSESNKLKQKYTFCLENAIENE